MFWNKKPKPVLTEEEKLAKEKEAERQKTLKELKAPDYIKVNSAQVQYLRTFNNTIISFKGELFKDTTVLIKNMFFRVFEDQWYFSHFTGIIQGEHQGGLLKVLTIPFKYDFHDLRLSLEWGKAEFEKILALQELQKKFIAEPKPKGNDD